MHFGRTTLSKFLIEQLREPPAEGCGNLSALLVDVAAAVKAISSMTAKGALGADWEALTPSVAPQDTGKSLDRMANQAVLRYCEWNGLLAAMASEEMETPYAIPAEYERGCYLLLFDPLHGSAGTEVNGVLGSLFSVLRYEGKKQAPVTADFLQAGCRQIAAGYALYGPSTMLVLTVGKGTHGFTLERETGNFLMTHPRLRVAETSSEVAINTGNERFWEPPVTRYLQECRAGATGVREHDFKIRWLGSSVAQLHRVLIRGGVFMYPTDDKDPERLGRLRLLFEANPMALLVEQAGGCASTGRGSLLDVIPEALHQRTPVILGSREEVQRIERYHREFDEGTDQPYVSPLFNERSLFREKSASVR